MDPISNLAAALDEARRVIGSVGADQWSAQSPCSEWDVRGVVNHMTGGAKMVAAGVAGAPFEHVEDYLGEDPVASFNAAADAALGAFRSNPAVLGSMITLPFGQMPGGAVAGIFTSDFLVHAWDVAKATGQSTDLNPALSEGVLVGARQMITDAFRKPGMFDAEQTAPEGATAADRLAAFAGRSV